MNDPEFDRCMKKALSRLNMGDLTAMGMFRFLTTRSPWREPFSEETAKKTVKKLIEENFIDDKRYLLLFLEKLDARCIGPRKIREELKKKDFSSRNIEKAMLRDIDYKSRAVKLMRSRKKELLSSDLPETRTKLTRFLVSNGFDFSTANEAIEEAMRNKNQED